MSVTQSRLGNQGGHDLAPRPPDSGVEANERISTVIGFLLLIMFAAQGVTILAMKSLLPWHDMGTVVPLHKAIGIALMPPVAVKLVTTGWKFGRYYLGDRRYRQAGPPHVVLRVLGPALVAATALMLATGFLGVLLHDHSVISIHKTTFWFWLGLAGLHVLLHLRGTFGLVFRDVRLATTDVFNRRLRWAIFAVTLTGGVVVSLAIRSLVS